MGSKTTMPKFTDVADWWREMRWVESIVTMSIDHLLDYASEAEEWLKREVEALEKESKRNLAATKDVERRSDLYDYVEDEYNRVGRVFPSILRSSVAISSYGVFEDALLTLCRLTHRFVPASPKPEWRQDVIKNAKNYLEKHRKVHFPKSSSVWPEIREHQTVRNILVHNGGLLDTGDRGKIKGLLGNGELVSVNNLRRLELGEAYCKSALEVYRRFFVGELFPNMPGEF